MQLSDIRAWIIQPSSSFNSLLLVVAAVVSTGPTLPVHFDGHARFEAVFLESETVSNDLCVILTYPPSPYRHYLPSLSVNIGFPYITRSSFSLLALLYTVNTFAIYSPVAYVLA
jgi:hypothetical protein